MADLPEDIQALFDSDAPNKVRGTKVWLERQTEQRQAEFTATITTYLKRRAKGMELSLPALKDALQAEFDYPFDWGALRNWMKRAYPELFKAQELRR